MVRSVLFAIGVVKIKDIGKIEKNARFLVCNHASFFDYLIICYLYDVRLIFNRKMWFEPLLEWMEPVKVEKLDSKKRLKKITKASDNFELPPLLYFAEESAAGKGQYITRFSSTPFSTPYIVQLLSIKYLVLKVSNASCVATYKRKSWEIFFSSLCNPLIFVEVSNVQSVTMENEGKASLPDYTETCQLILSNSLGIPAVDLKMNG